MNSIDWQPKALKQLRKLEAQVSQQIRAAVTNELVDLATARNVKALTNHEYGYRLRVGDHRGVFRVRRRHTNHQHRRSEEAR